MTSAQEPQAPLPESAEARIYELCLGGGDVDSGLRELQLRHPQHAAALAGLVRDLRRADNMVGGVRDLAGSAEAPVAPGTTWGNYRIVRELGRGGFGSVYLAEQHEPVRREVALKVVSAAASSPDMLQRFAAERQVLAQLSHPSIARVLDAGTTPAGQPYFAMDFLPGSPIAAFADERRLGVPARLQLFLQVCHAVQHAHQRGVLHRDLKPGNVLVAERDGGLVPCVIDFGLAKVLQQDAAPGAVGTTEFGRLLGTPEYMSPEQAMGEPVDTRTDVYSLGVMLFELLTGELPFSSERLRARGLGTVVQVLANEEPPLPSTALKASATATVAAHRRSTTVQDLARRLRGDLDGIVHACLQKDREQRYGSVAELAADLQRHLHHEPISVARPGAFYLLGKFARRHRAWFAASVLGGLGLLSGTAAIGWSLVRVTDARDRAIAAADAASRNAYAAAIAAAQSAGDSCRADAMRAHLAGTEPALRNLEWHVLQAQSEDALQVLAAGFDVPHCLVVHGKQATWFDVETSRIRRADLETGQVTEHGEHPWQVVQVVASRDGTRLVTGGTEGRLGVGDAQDLTLHRELRIGSQQVRGIALTPDGAQCLAADDRELVLVDVGTGAELARLRGHESFCWSVDIAPDGMRAASGDQDGKVRIWDLGRRETLHVLQHPVTVRQVSFHPDGSLLATAARDGVIRLWDARDGRLLASQATGAPIVHALAFSPDGSVLASAQSDGSVRAWDATTLLDLGAHRGHSAYVAGVTHAADGTLVTCAWDGTVRTWPARPRARHRSLEGMVGNTMRMALHPSEPVLAACSLGGEVAAWDLRDGRRLFARDLGGGMAHGIAFHPAGDRLYVTSDRGGIHVLDAHRGEQQLALPSRRMRVRDLQFRPGRDQLLVGGSNGEVVLLQASGLEVVQRMQPPPGSTVHNAMRTVVDPEGMVVVGCDPGHALRAWTIDTGTLLWERSADRPLDAGFAPGGALFACTSSGHVVELDPATGGELRRFGRGNPHQPVTHLQVTPDGQRLVTTDQRLRIWDLQAGRELLALDTVRYDPGAVLALPERGVLAAGGGYFTEPAELLLWPLGR